MIVVTESQKPPKKLTDEDYQLQAQMLQALVGIGSANAAGVACSLLLFLAENEPTMLRRVLNERVIRNGLSGDNLLNTLQRVAR